MIYRKNCLVCKNNGTLVWAKYKKHTAVECTGCGFIWINPIPTDRKIDDFYANYDKLRKKISKEMTDKRKLQYTIDRDFIYNFFINYTYVETLDFGCYDGSFLNVFDERFIKHGIEKNESAANWAKQNRAFGSNVYTGNIKNTPFKDDSFDLIIMRGVIEHLTHPDAVIEHLHKLLKKDGILYIAATPNADSFSAKKFRDKWNQFSIPEHLLYFSDYTLEKYLKRFGFEMLAKHFPYIETPYADLGQDLINIKNACNSEQKDTVTTPFYNNLMSMVFYKL